MSDMRMEKKMRMLFCTDGSEYAENAMRFGAIMAKALGAEVTVLSAKEKDLLPAYIVTNAISLLENLGIKARPKISDASPEEAIVEESYEHDIAVIGSHGIGGLLGFVFGSTSYKIIRHAISSVLVVRQRKDEIKKALICITPEEASFKVLRKGAEIAKALNVEICLITVAPELPERVKRMLRSEAQRFGSLLEDIFAHPHRLEEEALEKARKILKDEFEIRAKAVLKEGDAAEEIIRYAEEHGFDLIILGFAESEKHRIGSIAEKIAGSSNIPVLILRIRELNYK